MKSLAIVLYYKDPAMALRCIDGLSGHIVMVNNDPLGNLPLVEAQAMFMKDYQSFDVVAMLNDDLIFNPGSFEAMVSLFADQSIGIAAPGSSDKGTGILASGGSGIIDTDHVDNHAFFVSTRLIDRIGLPEVKGHTHRACWFWNQWYCYLARESGFRVVANLDAYVTHFGGRFNQEAYDRGLEWYKERLITYSRQRD